MNLSATGDILHLKFCLFFNYFQMDSQFARKNKVVVRSSFTTAAQLLAEEAESSVPMDLIAFSLNGIQEKFVCFVPVEIVDAFFNKKE